MKLSKNVTAEKEEKELKQLLQLKAEELEHYKKEQEIASSLERVQEKAMAMRSSEDISGAVAVVFNELNKLGIEMERCGIVIITDETPVMEVWSTPLSPQSHQVVEVIKGDLDSRIHPMLQEVYNSWKNGKKFFEYRLIGDEVRKYYELLGKVPDYRFPKIKNYADQQINSSFFFNEGQIFAFTKHPLSEEKKQIFFRFTNVFSHTYRRYMDIVKAEKQAREAEIEAALERVRGKGMAMRSSKDISEATAVVFNELSKLGIVMDRCGIATYNDTSIMEVWSTPLSPEDKQVIDVVNGDLDYRFNALLIEVREAWENNQEFYSRIFEGDEVKEYYTHLLEAPDYHFPVADEYPEKQVSNTFYFKQGFIFIWTQYELTEEVKELSKRFTKEFSRTYTRYLDLKKAEAQARESQVEASLERVRAKAMAMRSSKDISGATAVVFNELTRLGIEMERCGIGIFNDTPIMEIWSTPLSPKNKQVVKVITGKIKSDIHPMIQGSYQAWKNKKDFFTYELKGAEVKKYYSLLEKDPGYNFPQITNLPNRQILNSFSFDEGAIFVYTKNKLPEASQKIIQRFSKVFSLTYKRYVDIINAEKQAREAIKQASLNRVRGEIASMRNTEDLKRITPVIWRELKELEVPFIRCGVFIINDETEKIKAYLSTPAGEALAVLDLKFDENKLTKNLVLFREKNQVYKIHWNKEDFIRWMKSMMKSGQVQSAEKYQGSANAPESLHLHFIPFKQGMLYVGNTYSLSEEELDMVNLLAKSFSVAYARYEDFKNLEIAKEQIEKTLDELKAAQTQLVHSEKMASLGELTAGIAHEIQNPLNFVNNFSELSNELLDELKEEMENGNNDEVKELANDVIQNLKKINHHGKRAESIIKGMLLHSRGSSEQKELTDINSLCDEYLRLSYHGFRAKDKSFNADFKFMPDESIPKLNVIPQDIGRVLLNLINNAFHVVDKKAKSGIEGFKPKVVLSTGIVSSANGGKNVVQITVQDNGDGIPEKIKDKIFQPFFTTKPTGEGTGLGLSISYDIITKGHDGELKFKTTEGEGSEFIISLPIS